MRVGHFICGLNPFGTERVLETLLRHRGPAFSDQFVVSYWDGPMRAAYEALGVPVRVSREEEDLRRWLAEADLVNVHLLFASQLPPALAGDFCRPRIITIHWAAPFPPDCADHFIPTSAAAHVLQSDPTRCTLIENGVDLDRFDGRRKWAWRCAITRVSRPEKCAEFFWEGLTPVLERHRRVELWLVGTEESEGPAHGRVRPLGVVSDVAEVLARSRLFVHTPRPGEGAKDLSVMEAMAMGLPCVGSDVPCVRESAGEGSGVLLVPYNDGAALGAAVDRLLRDWMEASQRGKAARRYAVEHFDMRPRVRMYERVYEKVALASGRITGGAASEVGHLAGPSEAVLTASG